MRTSERTYEKWSHNVLQVAHTRGADQLLSQLAAEKGTDILFMTETNNVLNTETNRRKFCFHMCATAAV